MRRIILAAVLLLAGPAAAQTARDPAALLAEGRAAVAAAAAHARASARTPDEKAVVEADLAFAAEAKTRPVGDVFADWFLPNGMLFPPRLPLAVGPQAVRAAFGGDASLWEWAPMAAAAAGDLGVTWGVATISSTAADGTLSVVTTRYVTAWRKDAAGRWRVWLDVGTPGPLPAAPPAPAPAPAP